MAGRISSPRLIGRVQELARLEAALERARAGEPAAVVVAGEAGVGKTRLVQEFTTHAADTGAMVLVGGCVALTDAELPYAPVAQALRPLLRYPDQAGAGALLGEARGALARLLPELNGEPAEPPSADPGQGQASQARLFATLLRLLGRLAEQAPVVLVAEDLHWADRSTLGLLSFLLRNLEGDRVLVVGTWRSDELPRAHPVRRWLAEQQRTPRVETIELGPLSGAEVGEQLAAILGAGATPALVAEVVARSGGNPFYAEELAAAAAHSSGDRLPAGLRELLLARVLECSPAAQAVLRVAAVAGRSVSEQLLARVAAMPEAELVAGLRELLERQLLVMGPDQERYGFRHALVQEAVYGELLAGERRRLHASFAAALSDLGEAALADTPVTAAEIAVHWQHAPHPVLALEWSLRAAAEAERAYAFAEAWHHYEQALGLWDRVPDAQQRASMDQVEVLARAAEAAHLIEEHRRALALVELALGQLDAVAEPIRAGMLTERRGFYLWILGQREASLEAWQAAARILPADPPSRERAELLANYGFALAAIPRAQEAKAVGEEALAVARRVGADREVGRALISLGMAEATLGNYQAAIASLRQACQLAIRHADADYVGRAYGQLAHALIRAGRLAEAAEVALAGRDPVRQLGLQGYWHDYFLLANAAQALLELARWDEAEELLLAVRQSEESPTAGPSLRLAELQIGRGDFQSATAVLDTVKQRWGQAWPQNVAVAEHARRYFELVAELALWQGRLEAAGAAIRDGLTAVVGTDEQAFSGQLLWLGMRAAADCAQQARARHDPEELAGAAREAEALQARVQGMTPSPLAVDAPIAVTTKAVVAVWEAERSRLDGRSDAARWQAAAAAWLALGRPYPAAYAQWRHAEALLGTGQREQAAEAARAAHQTAARLGAAPLRAALEALARRARLDFGMGVPHEAGRAGLTPRELEVLRLLVAGKSNRQIAEQLFISGKTASVHVTNILAKLGVHSRLEAAATARRLGLDQSAQEGSAT